MGEVMDHFVDAGVEVEACNIDGVWRSCLTKEPAAKDLVHKCLSVLVMHKDGQEEYVPLGRVIVPGDKSSPVSDLAHHRGSNAEDLFKKSKDLAKEMALARGNNYCKPMVHSVCIRGVRHDVTQKRERVDETDRAAMEEEELRRQRHNREQQAAFAEKQEKIAAIESKYCAKVSSQASGSVPDVLRLG